MIDGFLDKDFVFTSALAGEMLSDLFFERSCGRDGRDGLAWRPKGCISAAAP